MKKDKFITNFKDIPGPRQKMPELSLEQRKLNFNEVELGYVEEIARQEVLRCLSCRRCIGCGLCLAECDQQAIVYDRAAESVSFDVDAIVFATGAESFDARKKPEFGYNQFPNVVTNIEMERILNANGPFGGLLLRPSDGDIPNKIAFIQCVGSRDELMGAGYCSNICCFTALKLAMAASNKIENLAVTIFYTDMRPFVANSENYFLKAKQKYQINFLHAKVESITAAGGKDNLFVNFIANGEKGIKEFDLVILSTGITPSRHNKGLSRKAGVKLSKFGFFPESADAPLAASEEAMWFAGTATHPIDIASSLTEASAVAAKVQQALKKRDLAFSNDSPEIAHQKNGSYKQSGIFFCRYGLAVQLRQDKDELIRLAKKNYPDFFITDLEFACNLTGKRKISETVEKEKLGKIFIAPCYENMRSVFSGVLSSAGLSDQNFSIFEIKENNGGFAMHEMEQQLSQFINSGTEKKSEIKSPAAIIKEAGVFGNSISSLKASLEIAEFGFPVHLFIPTEKIALTAQEIFWHNDKIEELVNQLVQRVAENSRIKLHAEAELLSMRGEAGAFELLFEEKNKEATYQMGALVLATGATAYLSDEFFYRQNQSVVTQFELKNMFNKEKFEYQNIVMIQCVGSRQPSRSFCSFNCCEQAVKNALKIKEKNPRAEIYVLHRDIRVYDFAEENYEQAIEMGVKFIRMENYPVVKSEMVKLKLEVVERDSQTKIKLNPDLLVLSSGLVPHQANKKLAEILNVAISEDGFFQPPDPILHPLELSQPGIFATGLALSPQRFESVMRQAVAVAGKIGLMFL